MCEKSQPGICRACSLGVGDHFDLAGPWAGWKLRGKALVSPDGDKITPERLRGLLFTESLRRRRRASKAGVQGLAVSFAQEARGKILELAPR